MRLHEAGGSIDARDRDPASWSKRMDVRDKMDK